MTTAFSRKNAKPRTGTPCYMTAMATRMAISRTIWEASTAMTMNAMMDTAPLAAMKRRTPMLCMIWAASTAMTVDATMDSALPAVARMRTVMLCTTWTALETTTADTNTDMASPTATMRKRTPCMTLAAPNSEETTPKTGVMTTVAPPTTMTQAAV
jgi:hypothetical protein